MPVKIVIIDYGMGNLHSILRKFERIGQTCEITGDPGKIMAADKLVLPGVGHFANGMKKLYELGIIDILNEKVLIKKTPVLGICLGMQLFAKFSEEGYTNGIGWLDSKVVRFKVSDTLKFKIPHMGWNSINISKRSILLKDIPENSLFYFVHSYHMSCNQPEDILATTVYNYSFVSAVEQDNIFGTQFHPEKSFEIGEQVLLNFINI
jgi:imidazole glycerol-phosphate synthase subunit HisH